MPERLTIGIPAYQEEKTIGKTLESIFEQRVPESVSLDVNICVRKGADRTEEIVVGLAAQRSEIKLITTDYDTKPLAWNLIKKAANPDTNIFVFCDADVVLDKDAVSHLYQTLQEDSKVQLVGAHLIMITEGRQDIWMKLINPVLAKASPKGTLNGRLYAIRKSATEAIGDLPFWLINEDEYLSLKIQQQFGPDAFQVNMQAKGYYTPPLTFSDYFNYRFRCEVGHVQIKKDFKSQDFDFRSYSTFRGRGNYLKNLSLREKMVLPVLGVINFWCKLAAGSAYEWGDGKRIEL